MKRLPRSRTFLVTLALLFIPTALFASGGGEHGGGITGKMTNLVFEIGVIIFAARVGGMLFERLKFPAVLGELVMGIIIGPYLLGGIPFPGFEHGLFQQTMTFVPVEGSEGLFHQVPAAFPISPELYGIATIASIILLFGAGLETDFSTFVKYSITGAVLGIGGFLISFIIGAGVAILLIPEVTSITHPLALFLGLMSTPTSVGITARILSERKKMDSPEGVSIMAGAVIDDILGIIILAIVLGITLAKGHGEGGIDWGHIGGIAGKAVGVWLGFTAVGLFFAHKISAFLKAFKSVTTFSILSLGLALLLAGVFEKAGLAMIVGAYVMGLSLSRTDLSFVIHDTLHTIRTFFVPIFFTVTGMLVDPAKILDPKVLLFGAVYAIFAIVSKIIGCGGPALLLKFNPLGALRIGFGMVPRGEVVLIMAGIGLSQGVLDQSYFGVAIMMILLTTIVAPPTLSSLFKVDKPGIDKKMGTAENVSIPYRFPSEELTEYIETRVVENFHNEGAFINVHVIDKKNKVYSIKKDEIDISLIIRATLLEFKVEPEDVPYVKNMMYETLIDIHEMVGKLKGMQKPEDMRKELANEIGRTSKIEIKKHLAEKSIVFNVKAETKEGVIEELVTTLHKNKLVDDKDAIVHAVLEREKTMSTGLKNGFAIPHAKCGGISDVIIAVGLKREGVDFDSLDNMPARIIVLILSPENAAAAHVQMIANISSLFTDDLNIAQVLACESREEVYSFFVN